MKRKFTSLFLGNEASKKSREIAQQLRSNGLACEIDFDEKSLKSQMRRANNLGCSHVVILGENEVKANKAQVKDFVAKTQKEIPLPELMSYFKQLP